MKHCLLILLISLLLAGCHRPAEKVEGTAKDLPTFKDGKGLLLPKETCKFIGLETVEVSERALTPEITTELQVYRIATNGVLATGFVDTGPAKNLKIDGAVAVRTKDSSRLTGKLVRVDDQAKAATGQVEVLVEIAAAEGTFPVGTFFEATFTSAKADSVIVIPRAALLRAAEGDFVFAVNGDHFLRTPVKVGAERDDMVEITDGLYAGDKVAVQPVQSLWLAELRFVKGGAACCEPPKPK